MPLALPPFAKVLLPAAMFACVNMGGDTSNTSTNIYGFPTTADDSSVVSLLDQAMALKPSNVTALSKFGTPHNELQRNEAKAVDMILSGDAAGAIPMLKELEQKWPREYATASNLGTAYELTGDNENALKWISAGLERNPHSHLGTEWLHVLILKAKIEAAKHPEQPIKARLLNLPDRMSASTTLEVDGKSLTIAEIELALSHQLQERMLFVKPKDVYVADLLYSYALIEANLHNLETGVRLLNLARQYGFVDEALLQEHRRHYLLLIDISPIWTFLLYLAALSAFLWFCHRKKWFFFSRRAYLEHKHAKAAAVLVKKIQTGTAG
jgi:hypothetical protein